MKNVDAIMRETGGRGVDVVFDTIGGNTLSRSPDTQALLERSYFSSPYTKGYCLSKKIMQQSQWNINEDVVSIAKG